MRKKQRLEKAMNTAAPVQAPEAIGMAMQSQEAAPRVPKAQRLAKLEALYVQVTDIEEIGVDIDWGVRQAFVTALGAVITRLRLS